MQLAVFDLKMLQHCSEFHNYDLVAACVGWSCLCSTHNKRWHVTFDHCDQLALTTNVGMSRVQVCFDRCHVHAQGRRADG